jgi:exodeoxyribonuclease-3
MKLVSWNVNGIRAVLRKEALQPVFDQLNPDILCFQETKAQPDQIELNIPGFNLIINSAEKKGYSGTAILSREKPIQTISNFSEKLAKKYNITDDGYGDPNTEGRVLAAEFSDFWVVTVYTPNSKDDLTRIPLRQKWDPAFAEFISSLSGDKPVYSSGDFNVAHKPIDLARPKENKGKKGFTLEERSGFDGILDKGFVDTFRTLHPDTIDAYSWWSNWGKARERNVGWRIDYWLAPEKSDIKFAEIHQDLLGSDHCPVSIEV